LIKLEKWVSRISKNNFNYLLNYNRDVFKLYDSIKNTIELQEAIQRASEMKFQMTSDHLNKSIIRMSQLPLIGFNEQLNKVYESINEMFKSTTRLKTIANTSNNKVIQDILNSQLIYNIDNVHIKSIANLSLNIKAIEETISQNLEILKNVDFSLLNQSIKSMDQIYDDFDIESTLDEAVADLNSNISLQQKILNILEKFKQANPIIFMLIYFFILSPLQSAYNDAVLNLIRSNTKPIIAKVNTSEAKVIEKNIVIKVNNVLNMNFDSKEVKQQILSQYRYVSTEKLIVRKNKSINSKAIYTLEFGQIVRLLYKNKNWTLIEYVEEDDSIIKGWVFTRYISRFKK